MVRLDDNAPERVTKVDAAKRQLREAIRMFFEERDVLAVHTVCAAAHQLLHDILKDRSQPTSFLRGLEIVRSERRKEFGHIVAAPENFLKHADRDPGGVLEYHPSLVKFFLLDAVDMYWRLSGKLFREALIFWIWFAMTHPDIVTPPPDIAGRLEVARQEGAHMLDPALFRMLVKELPEVD